MHASALGTQTKRAGNLESFPAPLDSPGSNYFSGAENGSDFRAQRSGRMHIQHMHISIIMFSEMGAYLIAAPPFRIRVTLGFTVIIKSGAQFVKYNPKDLQNAQIFVWNSQNPSNWRCAGQGHNPCRGGVRAPRPTGNNIPPVLTRHLSLHKEPGRRYGSPLRH